MSSLPKPVLRGHAARKGIQILIISFSGALCAGGVYHYFSAVPRKRGYVEFLKTYDAEAHTEDLIKWGYLKTPVTMKEKIQESLKN